MQHERNLQVVTGPIARIRGEGGAICGTGFLIGDRHVITCAHVIDDTVRRDRGTSNPPKTEVTLDLPFLEQRGLSARIVAWKPMRSLAGLEIDPVSDIAALELVEPIPGGVDSRNAQLSVPPPGTPFITYGFPAGLDNGTEAGGELRLTDAGGWRQVRDVQDRGYFVEPGFSGAPVFDTGDGKLLGMVTAVDQDAERRLAFVIPTPTLCQIWPLLAKPYKELFSFTEEDADLFFGRDLFIEELREKLEAQSYLTLIGPSGSGKSSVVMAGLVHRLRQEGGWAVVDCRPGRRPLYRLAYALEALTSAPTDTAGALARRATELEDQLRGDPERIVEHTETLLSRLHGRQRLLLVLDQFEELFTHDDAARVGKEEALEASERQREFIAVLAAIGRQGRKCQLRAIATMRADFTGRALQDRVLSDLLRDADVKLGPMTPAELASAVENPASRFGVSFEQGLVPQIVTVSAGSVGSLPLLQFALDRLWRRQQNGKLTRSAYKDIGGVEGALAEHAEDVFVHLDPEGQSRARRILTRLVRLAGPGEQSEDTRAVVTRAEIGEENWRMVQMLTQERLIMTGRAPETGEETAEVIHEALIRAWPRLRDWLNEDREFGLWRQRLKGDVARWNGTNQDALLRGELLAEAETRMTSHKDDLNDAERDFIDASTKIARIEAHKNKRDKEDRFKLLEEKNAALATNQAQQKKSLRWLSALAAALLIAIVGTGYFAWQRNSELGRAITAEKSAENARKDADNARFQAESDRDRAIDAIDLADKQRRLAQESEKRAIDATGLAISTAREAKGRQLASDARVLISEVGGAQVAERAAALAIESWRLLPGVQSYQVAIKSMSELPLHRIEHGVWVYDLAFSPDGTRIATASGDGTVLILNVQTGEEIARIKHGDKVTAVAFSPDGTRIATTSGDNAAHIFNAYNGEEIARFDHGDMVTAVAFSPDGTRLATASLDNTALILNAQTGEEIARIKHGDKVHAVAFSPDGTRLATASGSLFFDESTVRILNAQTREEIARIKYEGMVTAVAFSPDGTRLATASGSLFSSEGTVRILNARTREEIARITYASSVNPIVFSPDGKRLAIGSGDNTTRILNAQTGQEIARIEHGGSVTAVAFSPDGTRIATASGNFLSDESTVRILDAQTGEEIAHIELSGSVTAVAFSPDGTRLATASDDNAARVLDAQSGEEITHIDHGNQVFAVAFSPDGTRLATASGNFLSDESTVRILDAQTGEEIARIEHGDMVTAVAFSPDGTRLATASGDNAARILDTQTGEEIARFDHGNVVIAVAFSPDGTRIATASGDNTAHILDTQTGEEIARIEHGGSVTAVAFSPDGTRIATASGDNAAHIFNAYNGEEIARIEHGDIVIAVAFSLDGIRIATTSNDGIARIFDADLGRIFERLCEERAGRNLTRNEWERYIGFIEPWRPTCPQWRNAEN
ncbi:MAG: PQQ-binding-like beta-propeller repeat protein [Sedimentitalea sp.]|uniref:nSTAND1 domain-containing NTPase n=1 Tax=Sedimentitalea sp. TaxID=2048915 RepID=UPI003299904B